MRVNLQNREGPPVKTFRLTTCDSEQEAERAAAYFREEQNLPSAEARRHQDQWIVTVKGRGNWEAAHRRADQWEMQLTIPTSNEGEEIEETPEAWNRSDWKETYEGG